MSDFAERFVTRLAGLDRGAMSVLRRSLGFEAGAYVPAFPFIEPFAAKGGERVWMRAALYLSAGLYALHPSHRTGQSLASGMALSMSRRSSSSIERRFIGLLDSDREGVGQHLRRAVSVLAADGIAIDHAQLLDDLGIWLAPRASNQMDRVKQRWARDFYRSDSHDLSVEARAGYSLVVPTSTND
jgi:CRISPR system Cascade subunit CasB